MVCPGCVVGVCPTILVAIGGAMLAQRDRVKGLVVNHWVKILVFFVLPVFAAVMAVQLEYVEAPAICWPEWTKASIEIPNPLTYFSGERKLEEEVAGGEAAAEEDCDCGHDHN